MNNPADLEDANMRGGLFASPPSASSRMRVRRGILSLSDSLMKGDQEEMCLRCNSVKKRGGEEEKN